MGRYSEINVRFKQVFCLSRLSRSLCKKDPDDRLVSLSSFAVKRPLGTVDHPCTKLVDDHRFVDAEVSLQISA